MNALILGASGQDGHYLSQVCREAGLDLVTASRSGSGVRLDVAEFEQVSALIRRTSPDYVFHLAAASTTHHDALFENHRAIATGALNVLEAVRRHRPTARVFLAGSGLQFANRGVPICESDPFQASNPYSLARIHAAYAGRYYRSLGLAVFIGYLFHHESPLRKPQHVSRLVALAAGRIARGSGETVEIGDPSVEKEWTFAGDVARAIFALASQDAVSEAVIGSGVTHTIQDWLASCFGLVGMDWREHVRIREGFTPEYRRLVSNPATIRALGWQPRVGFAELARMMMVATGQDGVGEG